MPVNNTNVEVNRPASPVFGVAGVVNTVGVVGGVPGVVCTGVETTPVIAVGTAGCVGIAVRVAGIATTGL